MLKKVDINGVKRYDLTNYDPPSDGDASHVYIPFKKGDTGRFEYLTRVKPDAGWHPVRLIDRSIIVDYKEY